MTTDVASIAAEHADVVAVPVGALPLREAALGAVAVLLGTVFLLLLAADQAQRVAGA